MSTFVPSKPSEPAKSISWPAESTTTPKLLVTTQCGQGEDQKHLLRHDVVGFPVFPTLQASKVDLVARVFEVSAESFVFQLLHVVQNRRLTTASTSQT